MTKNSKEQSAEDPMPELLVQLKRIADALERQVELEEGRQKREQESLQAGLAAKDGQREQRRKRFEEQIKKLAEVDRMARELRQKIEEKQAAEAAARAESEGEEAPADGEAEATEKSSVPPEN